MSKVSRGYGTSLVLDPHQYSQDPDWPGDKVCCESKASHFIILRYIMQSSETYLRKRRQVMMLVYNLVRVVKTEINVLMYFIKFSLFSSHFTLNFFVCCSFCVQNFTYTWFCRTLTDPEHPTVEGRPQEYNSHPIPKPLSSTAGGGCFGQGPGNHVRTSLISTLQSLTFMG